MICITARRYSQNQQNEKLMEKSNTILLRHSVLTSMLAWSTTKNRVHFFVHNSNSRISKQEPHRSILFIVGRKMRGFYAEIGSDRTHLPIGKM